MPVTPLLACHARLVSAVVVWWRQWYLSTAGKSGFHFALNLLFMSAWTAAGLGVCVCVWPTVVWPCSADIHWLHWLTSNIAHRLAFSLSLSTANVHHPCPLLPLSDWWLKF